MPLFWFRIGLIALLPLMGFADPVKVWVELRDKGPVGAMHPSTTLRDLASSVQAPARAWEDAPVYAPYLKQLQQAGFTPEVTLKWQNRVSGWIDPEKLADLNRLSIVRDVEGMPRKSPYSRWPGKNSGSVLSKTQAVQVFGPFQAVFDTIQATALRNAVTSAGQTAGQGMKISVIDADFSLGHEAFALLKQAGRIVDQWDFVSNKSTVVKDSLGDSHGAAVLSLLAGKSSTLEGLVPDAKYLLYRSENITSETYVEEDYVAAAIERSVDSGAKVISISLGYRYGYSNGSPDLPYSSMNGRTRPSTLAALGAARRNVLVTVAMGNEGPTLPTGPTIAAPADADSILSVGILDLSLKACSYTSTGPTYDHRVKPEVATVGPVSCATPTVNPTTTSAVVYQGGTSFAAPVMAGVAVLLRQLHPTATAQAVRLALMTTAAKYTRPDSAAGYGLARSMDAHAVLSIPGTIFTGPRYFAQRKIPSSIQVRDIQGRSLPVHAGAAIPVFWIDPANQAAGVYIWKTP